MRNHAKDEVLRFKFHFILFVFGILIIVVRVSDYISPESRSKNKQIFIAESIYLDCESISSDFIVLQITETFAIFTPQKCGTTK